MDKDTEIELSNNLPFEFNSSLDNHLCTVERALQAEVYKTVDLKVKILMKKENNQPIVKERQTTYTCDTLVSDHTDYIKLVLWEDKIDKVRSGKSYHFTNLTVCFFDG